MPTLNWIGKEAVINYHLEVPFRLLKDVPELGCGDPGSGNLIVEGDNLVALKALLPYYKGKVKCICIDPPYNTGNEGWAYNDNVNSPAIRKWIGDTVGKEGETLDRHDRWLCMMYPRLALLREFLSEDGVIFITLDDNEIHALRYLMDDIFGTRNFVGTICWQKKQSPSADAINLSPMHDYILVYAKKTKESRDDPTGWNRNLIPRGEVQDARFTNQDNDPRGSWTSTDYTCNKTAKERPNLYYPIINPNTDQEIWPSKTRVWAYERSAHDLNVLEGRIWWGSNGKGKPRIKKYSSEVIEGVVPSTWWDRVAGGDNQLSRRELRELMHDAAVDFSTPKPTTLFERIPQIATNPGDLILDSFAGSGTTGHAVLKMNAAGRSATFQSRVESDVDPTLESRATLSGRRFILVEMEPKIAQDITRERVKRVAEGYTNAKGEAVAGLGGGFRYVRLGEELFDEHGRINERDVRFADLARHVYFSETGEPLPKERISAKTPLLGIHHGRAVYLLYNGILKDKSVDGGNVLTATTLAHLPPHNGPKVIYAAGCRFSKARLERENITLKQTPYAIRTR